MPIKCKLIEEPLPEQLKPGDMFHRMYENTGRKCLIVILPNGGHFDLTWAAEVGDGTGTWEVSGEAPNITVYPSINALPSVNRPGYHGYLNQGVLSDDLEGRSY